METDTMPGPDPSRRSFDRTTVLLSVVGAVLASVLIITCGVLALRHAGGGGQTVVLGADGRVTESPSASRGTSSTARTSASPTSSTSPTSPTTSSGVPAAGVSAGPASAPGPGSADGASAAGDNGPSGTEGGADTDGATDGVPTPTAAELTDIVHLLTATDAPDEEKQRHLESPDAVIVPQTVYRAGLFRAPRGGSEVTGPVERDGDTATAELHAWSQGIPDVTLPVTFVYRDGTWRLSSASVCTGVRTVGLPVYCNA